MKRYFSNFIALDIGSSKISAIAAHITKQGSAQINTQILQHSSGFNSGLITNMESAENSIINTIYALEKDCEKSIKEVAISLSGASTASYYVKHSIKIGNQAITSQDIQKLINKALLEFNVNDQEIIHYFPIEFKLDGRQIVENPVSLHARELSCQLHIVAANSSMILNLTKCLAKCHVEVSEILLAIYASGLAVLSQDEMKLGSIVIDIGANTASYGIFLDNNLVYSGYVPSGGKSITTEIAKVFSISLKEAEKLKILYGNANPNLLLRDSVIKLENNEQTITSAQLIAVIHPQIKDLLLKIKQQCDSIAMDHLLSQQVVITGGGAALEGTKSLATDIFQKQIRLAKPAFIPGTTENYNPYANTTIIGMIQYKLLRFRNNTFKSDQYHDAGWLKRTFLWLKENI